MGKKKLALINKDMLIWAREKTPFKTPEDVEKRFPGISAEKLKKWENGDELPSITEAKDLASKYKLPFACFYLSSFPTAKIKPYTDRRTFAGTDYGEMSYELWKEIDRIESDRETLLEYYNEEEVPLSKLPIFSESDTIERIAAKIRAFFELPISFKNKNIYKQAFNYFRLKIERKGIIVSQISEVDLYEMKGLSIYNDVFPIIGINNKDFERAKVFSLFHELAHLIRRSSSLCLINYDERNDDEEKFCDKLAAEILMDENEFKHVAVELYSKYGDWSDELLSKLSDRFGVSTVSAFRRLFELNLIDSKYYYDRYKEINDSFNANIDKILKAQEGKNIPFYFHVRFINSHGHLLPKAVISAHYSGRISLGEACKVLNVKSKFFGDLSKAVMVL